MNNIKKSKVVCTLGPSSSDPETIRKLIKNGMNVARLNFSHGTHDSHRKTLRLVRDIAKELGTYVGIMQDLCGPKIRLGNLPEEGVPLRAGQEIALNSSISNYEDGKMPVSYPNLSKEVKTGEVILLADGSIELNIVRVEGNDVICEVMNGGIVFSRKGVNLPFTNLSISAFSNKDREDFMMGLEEKVDYVALSFVRNADDIKEIKEIIKKSDFKPLVCVKIEKPQAIKNFDSILKETDLVMIARGDLGVELPLEQVPILQKQIIQKCRNAGKSVIIATQMLMSMVTNPRPTRGETSDVANGVLDGTDAVMLSDESANGKYPVEACSMLSKIAMATEPHTKDILYSYEADSTDINAVSKAVGRASVRLAEDINAKVIIAFTYSGFTASAVAQFRPRCPILALTTKEETCRQLTLTWGTTPVLVRQFLQTEQMYDIAAEYVLTNGYAKKGDKIVLTAGIPLGVKGSTNLLRVLEL